MIGLLHGGAVGDFVLAWHLLESVKQEARDPRSVIVARGPVAATVPAIWRAAELHDTDAAGLHRLFSDEGDVTQVDTLRNVFAFCDLIVNLLTDSGHSAARRLASLARGRVCSIESRASGEPQHITQQWRFRLAAEGLAIREVRPAELHFEEPRRSAARARLESAAGISDGPIVLIQPGSGGRSKCWPLDNFLELSDGLHQVGRRPVFLWGPVERETWPARDAERVRRSACIAPRDLKEAVYLAGAADAYVGNDSGMSHVAAATGTRTVVLFGATDPRVWRPLGANVRSLGNVTGWPGVDKVLAALG